MCMWHSVGGGVKGYIRTYLTALQCKTVVLIKFPNDNTNRIKIGNK